MTIDERQQGQGSQNYVHDSLEQEPLQAPLNQSGNPLDPQAGAENLNRYMRGDEPQVQPALGGQSGQPADPYGQSGQAPVQPTPQPTYQPTHQQTPGYQPQGSTGYPGQSQPAYQPQQAQPQPRYQQPAQPQNAYQPQQQGYQQALNPGQPATQPYGQAPYQQRQAGPGYQQAPYQSAYQQAPNGAYPPPYHPAAANMGWKNSPIYGRGRVLLTIGAVYNILVAVFYGILILLMIFARGLFMSLPNINEAITDPELAGLNVVGIISSIVWVMVIILLLTGAYAVLNAVFGFKAINHLQHIKYCFVSGIIQVVFTGLGLLSSFGSSGTFVTTLIALAGSICYLIGAIDLRNVAARQQP